MLPTYIAFYVGRVTPVSPPRTRGSTGSYHARIRHVFRVYPGGHAHALWRDRARAGSRSRSPGSPRRLAAPGGMPDVVPRERRGADNDPRERGEPDGAERAAGQPSWKSARPGGDRERVREQRRGAGGRERAAALECELQRDERSSVGSEHDWHEEQPAAADRAFVATSPAA